MEKLLHIREAFKKKRIKSLDFCHTSGGEGRWFGWTPHFFKSMEKRVFFGALHAFLHFFDPFLPQNYQMWGVRGQGLGGVEKNPNFFLEGFPKVLCFRLRNISWCCVACKAVWKIFFQTTKVFIKQNYFNAAR